MDTSVRKSYKTNVLIGVGIVGRLRTYRKVRFKLSQPPQLLTAVISLSLKNWPGTQKIDFGIFTNLIHLNWKKLLHVTILSANMRHTSASVIKLVTSSFENVLPNRSLNMNPKPFIEHEHFQYSLVWLPASIFATAIVALRRMVTCVSKSGK